MPFTEARHHPRVPLISQAPPEPPSLEPPKWWLPGPRFEGEPGALHMDQQGQPHVHCRRGSI